MFFYPGEALRKSDTESLFQLFTFSLTLGEERAHSGHAALCFTVGEGHECREAPN